MVKANRYMSSEVNDKMTTTMRTRYEDEDDVMNAVFARRPSTPPSADILTGCATVNDGSDFSFFSTTSCVDNEDEDDNDDDKIIINDWLRLSAQRKSENQIAS